MSDKPQVVPMRDFVLVEVVETKTTPGGLVLPSSPDEKILTGVVLAKGPGFISDNGTHISVTASVDDKVVFHKSSMIEFKVEGEKYFLVRDEALLARVQ